MEKGRIGRPQCILQPLDHYFFALQGKIYVETGGCSMDQWQEDGPYRERQLQRLLLLKLGQVSREMEKFNIAEYIALLNNPRRYLLVNFMGGIARGLGIALGATLLAAVVIYFLQRLVMLNLPLIGDFIADLIKIVSEQL